MAQPPILAPDGTAPASPREGERIAKLLARAGIASRREVERMIAEGRIKIGDEVLTTPATVLTDLKGVTVDGKPVRAAEAARLFAFHKPAGLLTAERDPGGRPTIYTALRNALPPETPRVMPVGRLDFNTEGLLLLTNDGELKRAMELPSTGIPRTYRARTFGTITQVQLEALSEGIEIEGIRYGSINANMERSTGRNQWIEMTITEGKNREVRRVLEHLGLEVSRLIRTAYGPFQLLDLPRGVAVEIRRADVEKFAKALGAGTGTNDMKIERVAPRPLRAKPAPAPEVGKRPWTSTSSGTGTGTTPAAPARAPTRATAARSMPTRTAPGAGATARAELRSEGRTEARTEPRTGPRRAASATATGDRRPARPALAAPGGRREARTEQPVEARAVDARRAAAAERRASPKPPRKADDRDRGEKLLDRPKEHRKPSGWAKAKAPRHPGKPGGGKGPSKPSRGK